MNTQIFTLINNFRNPVFDVFSTIISNFFFILALVLIILVWVVRHDKKNRFYIFLGMSMIVLIELILVELFLKIVFYAPRPYSVLPNVHTLGTPLSNGSFPSGHIALMVAILSLVCFYRKKFILPACIFALVLGWSRIYNGVHWPTDILWGILIGLLNATLVIVALELLRKSLDFAKKKAGTLIH